MSEPALESDDKPTKLRQAGWIVALLVLVAAVFSQTVSFGLIDTWDDADYFLNRPEVRNWFEASWSARLTTPSLGYPVPLPTFLYYLVQQAPPAAVVPLAHGLNVVLHVINALFVFVLARRWVGKLGAAAVIAMFWACHPLMAEPVAWVTNLKFMTMGTSCLLGLYAWDRYLVDSDAGPGWAALAVGCVVAALASQPQGLALGPALVVQALARGPKGVWKSPRALVPVAVMALISIAYLPVALGGQHELIRTTNFAGIYDMPVGQRLERIGAAFSLQVQHLFWPVNLHPTYSPTDAQMVELAMWGWGLLAASLVITGLALWKNFARAWPLALAWVFYLPASGIDFLPRLTADAYMYMPLVGLLIGAVMLASGLLERFRHKYSLAFHVLIGVLLLCEVALCVVQTRRWRNAVTLMEPTLAAYPDWPIGYHVLAGAYAKAGERERALEILEESLGTQYEYGMISLNMPGLYERLDRPAGAANVLLLMSEYRGMKVPNVEAELLRVVVQNRLALPTAPARREKMRQAMQKGLEQAVRAYDAGFFVDAARHLLGQGALELAQRSLEQARRAHAGSCQWWSDARSVAAKSERLQLPEAPADCR